MKNERSVLITGAGGQLGTALIEALLETYPEDSILVTDIKPFDAPVRTAFLDITDTKELHHLVKSHNCTEIYHLAAILSAKGEMNPEKIWNVNMKGLLNILDVAVEFKVKKVFFPSSIAVFGTGINRAACGQWEVQHPSTVYGITKSAGENWCQYYYLKHGLDVRSIRYPGVIGPDSLPGGGTTDYAVHIFHEAINRGTYICYLQPDTRLPMIHIDDTIQGTLKLMQAPKESIKIRTSYNIQELSFTPAELAAKIKLHIPDFTIKYDPDYRQEIAETWPEVLVDTDARNDWGWNPRYDINALVENMIKNIDE